MNKILLIFILLFFFGIAIAEGQYVSVPDSNFRHALISQGFSSCFDATLTMLDTTCGALDSTRLNVSGKGISDIDGLQYFRRLKVLLCTHNSLTHLPRLPDSLSVLYCFANLIDSLPTLPTTLTDIDLSSNNVHFLPPLPPSLTNLDCAGNPIDSFPALPSRLYGFSCGGFLIRHFPPLPASLRFFWCPGAGLDSLPLLPDSLASLRCSRNSLAKLLPLPINLSQLDCGYNRLTYLPALPDSLHFLYCNNNPQLDCLPHLSKIDYLDFDSTAVVCLPDTGQVASSSPLVNTFPICAAAPCYSLGIRDIFANVRMACYPSPTSGTFTVDMTGFNAGEKQISIYNQLGQVVYQTASTQDKILVDEKLASGLYTVIAAQNSQRAISRICVE